MKRLFGMGFRTFQRPQVPSLGRMRTPALFGIFIILTRNTNSKWGASDGHLTRLLNCKPDSKYRRGNISRGNEGEISKIKYNRYQVSKTQYHPYNLWTPSSPLVWSSGNMIWGTWHIYLDGVYDLLTYSMNILSTAKPLPNMPREDDKRSPTHNTISSHHVFRCSGYKKVVGLGSSIVSWLLTVDSTARHSGGSLSQPLQFIKLSIQVSVFFIVPTS